MIADDHEERRIHAVSAARVAPGGGRGGRGCGVHVRGRPSARTFDLGLSLVITGTPAGVFQSVVPSQTEPRAT